MSDRSDNENKNWFLIGIGAVVIVLAVALGAYLGWRANSRSVERTGIQKSPGQTYSSSQIGRRDEPLPVKLYYPVNEVLLGTTASAKRQADTQAQARETLSVFLSDERAAQVSVLKDIKVQDLYLDAAGTAYVDVVLNQKDVKASLTEELLGIYAIVDTLTANFEEIKQVMLLVEGRETKVLAGHIDLTRKYAKRADLVKE